MGGRIDKIAKARRLLEDRPKIHINELIDIFGWSKANCYRIAKDMQLLYIDFKFQNCWLEIDSKNLSVKSNKKNKKKKFNIDDYKNATPWH